MNPYRQELIDRVMSRDRVLVTDWDAWRRDVLPTLGRVAIGRDSYSAQVEGNHWRKYVDVDDWPFTETELVREFLRDKLTAVPKGGWIYHYKELRWLDVPAPLHWIGGTVRGELAYLDLVAAFYTIYRDIGFYDPHPTSRGGFLRGWVDLDGVEMFRRDHVARNSVVGFARTLRHTEYRDGERVTYKGPSALTSPGLWGEIVRRLRQVARDAVESFGAVYVATDGYILPVERVASFTDYLGARGHRSRTCGIGEATVTGLGSYAVGDYRSLKLRKGSPALSNLNLDDGAAVPS